MKLLVHINETERWPAVLASVENFLNDVGDQAEVIILVNGAGVQGFVLAAADPATKATCSLADGAASARQAALAQRGVSFKACRNALQAQEIDAARLPDYVEVVPAGMTELVRRQAGGFAYIKP